MKPMEIECLIRRKGGTDVTLGDTTIKFRPVEQGGAHIAKVDDKAHIGKLLAIPEAYAIYDPDGTAPKAPKPKPNVPEAPDAPAPDKDDAEFDDDADDFEDDGVEPTGDPEPEPEDADEEGPTLEDMVADPALITEDIANKASGPDLELLFHAKIGRPPNPRSKDPKRREHLVAAIRGEQ